MAIVGGGSITAAAEQLGQTVSGVSRALGRLEAKLETTMLRRTTRRIELTEEGASFLVQARAILASIDAAEEQVVARREQPSGLLRVNAATPFMLHVIAPLMTEFRLAFPRITLELDTDELNIDLLERRTDIAVRIGVLRDSTLHARTLGASRLRILASPDYLAAHGRPRTVADLALHTLLGFTQPEMLNHWPLRGPHGNEWKIEPAIRVSSGETLRRLALHGAGIACISDFMTHEDRERGNLVQVLANETGDVRQTIHAVYYRNTQLAARISCFLDFLVGRIEGAFDQPMQPMRHVIA